MRGVPALDHVRPLPTLGQQRSRSMRPFPLVWSVLVVVELGFVGVGERAGICEGIMRRQGSADRRYWQ